MPPKPTGDGMDYENIAFHLARGDGYVVDTRSQSWRSAYAHHESFYESNLSQPRRALYTTGRPPLYPTLIAGCYLLAGRNESSFRCIRLLNAAFLALAGALSVVLTYWLLTQIESKLRMTSFRFAIWLGCGTTLVMAAAQNTLASYANDFLTESLALCLMQSLIMVLVWCRPNSRYKTWLLAGVFLGLLILCRSIYVAWIPGMAVLAYFSTLGSTWISKESLIRIGCFVAIACAVCLPWWLRNCIVLNSATPLGTQGSITLLGGYSDMALASGGDWQPEPEQALRASLALPSEELTLESGTRNELVIAQEAKSNLGSWIQNHWHDLPSLMCARIRTHWNPYYGKSLIWKLTALVGLIFTGLYLPRIRVWIIGLPILSTVAVALLYSVGGRFLVPMYGLLFTLSGICIGGIAMLVGTAKNAAQSVDEKPSSSHD